VLLESVVLAAALVLSALLVSTAITGASKRVIEHVEGAGGNHDAIIYTPEDVNRLWTDRYGEPTPDNQMVKGHEFDSVNEAELPVFVKT